RTDIGLPSHRRPRGASTRCQRRSRVLAAVLVAVGDVPPQIRRDLEGLVRRRAALVPAVPERDGHPGCVAPVLDPPLPLVAEAHQFSLSTAASGSRMSLPTPG